MTANRFVPNAYAAILTELELTRPTIVTERSLEPVVKRGNPNASTMEVIRRLREMGWLLPLRVRGAWEFAPADRAGPLSGGDPFIEVRALLAVHPDSRVAVGLESAAFLRGLASRQPNQEVLVVSRDLIRLKGLDDFRRVDIDLPGAAATPVGGLAVHTPTAVLATIAIRPSAFHDWPGLGEWLPGAAAATTADEMNALLQGRAASAHARAAYLLRQGGNQAAATRVLDARPAGTGPYYLGPRRGGVRDNETDVVDSVVLRYAEAGQGAS